MLGNSSVRREAVCQSLRSRLTGRCLIAGVCAVREGTLHRGTIRRGSATTPIAAAADALRRIVVKGERERSATAKSVRARGYRWTDTLAPAATETLDVPGRPYLPAQLDEVTERRRSAPRRMLRRGSNLSIP